MFLNSSARSVLPTKAHLESYPRNPVPLSNLNSIMFFVADIQASRDWYRTFLGVDPVEDLPRFSSFKIGESFLNLHLADVKSPLSTGGQVAYWSSDDFDTDIKRAVSLQAVVWRGPLEFEPGKRICQIKDPFGNVFGLENW